MYEDVAYRERADHAKACRSPLSSEDQAWAAELIRTVATKQNQVDTGN